MARYIDTEMRVDASATHRRLQWEPTPALTIVARLRVLVENMKTDPVEWERRNRAAIKSRRTRRPRAEAAVARGVGLTS